MPVIEIALSLAAALSSGIAMVATGKSRDLMRLIFRSPKKQSLIIRVEKPEGEGYIELAGNSDAVVRALDGYIKSGQVVNVGQDSLTVRLFSGDLKPGNVHTVHAGEVYEPGGATHG